MEEAVFISPGGIRGYRVYSTIWEAESGEVLTTSQERGNVHDRFAVAVKKERLTVGHLPIEISKLCWFFIRRGGTITCEVTGTRRRSNLEQGGLEIPCNLTFKGPTTLIKKNLRLHYIKLNFEMTIF